MNKIGMILFIIGGLGFIYSWIKLLIMESKYEKTVSELPEGEINKFLHIRKKYSISINKPIYIGLIFDSISILGAALMIFL